MTIVARFPGRCRNCGAYIPAGAQVEWDKQSRRIAHVNCADASKATPARQQVARVAPALLSDADSARILAEAGSSFAEDETRQFVLSYPPAPGALFQHRGKHYLALAHGDRFYHSEEECEDMDCFCGDYGWRTTVVCREITEPPAARAKREAAERKQTLLQEREAIYQQLRDGTYSEEKRHINSLGTRVADDYDLYGGGYGFALDEPGGKIWLIINNGSDGDDWGANNIQTWGAGAIGRYVPYDSALADQLRAIDAIMREKTS